MTEQECQDLEDMTREQLLGQIMYLRKRVAQLEEKSSEMSWRLNPDRMGGQYTPDEYSGRRDEW